MGFEADGNVTALAIRGWFLTGAELDLGDNDPAVLPSGIDQARPPTTPCIIGSPALLTATTIRQSCLQALTR